MAARKLISIVTPCYNEEGNVLLHFQRVTAALAPFRDRYDFEHIYTDNCSEDGTFELLRALTQKHANVRAMRFSRNIGAPRAIFFGLMAAKGDAAVLIQADLQDPPELIPDFIKGWEAGHDVVYGKITNREEAWLMKSGRRLYYKIISKFSEVPPAENAGEFRLASRRVLDAISQFTEDDLYLRGVISHIGYRQLALPYSRAARNAGRTSTHLPYLIGFALNGLISTTVVPLRLVIVLGLVFSGAGFLFSTYIVVLKLVAPQLVPTGVATILAVLTFFAGAQMLALGIVGEYIRKIYVQSLRRPQGFVQDRLNF